jgi:hypothetical protein
MAARSPYNGNRAGFETPAPATCVALASDYLDPAGDATADRNCRALDETDVLVGTSGFGVYYNTSGGMAYKILDADGSVSTGVGLATSFLSDGMLAEYFDGSEDVFYIADSDEPCGYDLAVDTTGNGTPDTWVLDGDGDTPAFANMTRVTTFGGDPSYSWKYIDSNGNGTYDHDQYEEIVQVRGWSQSTALGTGVFVNRMCTFQIAGTDYAFVGTDSGIYRSYEGLQNGVLGRFWEDAADATFTGVKITDVICSGNDVFASSYSNGMFYTAAGDGAPVTWVKIDPPTAVDTLLEDGTGTSANGDNLSVFVDSDNIMFKDADGNGVYNGTDPVFIDANSDNTYNTGETILDGAGLADGDAGISGVEADEWIRYVDTNGNMAFDEGVDDVYLDRDSDGYVDLMAETYNRITCLAYSSASDVLYCGTQTGGVFRSTVGVAGDYSTWAGLDTRMTGLSIARLKWAEVGAADDEKLYVGSARKGLLVEYDIAGATCSDVSRGESSTKIDTTIMDRTPVLFSGHIAPVAVYDLTRWRITDAVPPLAADETNEFVFGVVLEDDFDNPPVAGTEIRVTAVHHEITRKFGANGIEEKDTTTNLNVGGFGNWTVADTVSSGRGSSMYTYSIAPQALDGDYDGDNLGVPSDALEYVEVTITVEFPRDSNYGSSAGGTWTINFLLDMF